jgi:hypothetical protein
VAADVVPPEPDPCVMFAAGMAVTYPAVPAVRVALVPGVVEPIVAFADGDRRPPLASEAIKYQPWAAFVLMVILSPGVLPTALLERLEEKLSVVLAMDIVKLGGTVADTVT